MVVLCTLAGCGATGLDWASQAHFDGAEQRASVTNSSNSQGSGPASIPATADSEAPPEARPRLNHVVTLGEVDMLASTGAAPGAPPAAPAAAGVSVTINNYNLVNSGAMPGYASVGYARSQPSFSSVGAGTGSRASMSGSQPGQNWPAISDHGPSFPYRSAPASPWGRTQ